METRRSDEILRGGNGHVVLEPQPFVHAIRADDAEENDRAPDDIRCLKCNAAPGDWCGMTDSLVVRPIAELQSVILHELRTSGPLGLHVDELEERIGCRVDGAVNALADEGRVVVRGNLVTMSAAQKDLEEATRDAVVSTADLLDERDHAIAATRFWGTHDASTYQDVISWREAFANLLDVMLRPPHPRPHAELGRHLNSLYRDVTIFEKPLGIEVPYNDAYALAIGDAAWIASYGSGRPPLLVARLLLRDGTCVRCAVLGKGDGGWLLSAPGIGRVWSHGDGVMGARVKGYRVHPDDLVVLEGMVQP